ncbi:MAG TPA: PAS domain S-box protein [Gaiellaceae bacterium]|nr:PAS domain S-box protein [Gaiellaceae bacterium]
MRRGPLHALSGASLMLAVAAYLVPERFAPWVANAAFTLAGLFAVAALTVACRRIGDPERRRPWAYLLAACCCWLAAQIAWDVLYFLHVVLPFPSVADVGWLVFAPLALAGVYRLAPSSTAEKAISVLDTMAVGVGVGTLVGVLHYRQATDSNLSTAGIVVALAYAVLHSAAAATIAQSLCTRLSLLRRPDLLFLLVGLLAQGVAFSLWAGALLEESYTLGSEPIDLLWTIGLIAIGIGGLKAVNAAPVERTTERDIRLRGVLPILAIVGLILLLMRLARTEAPIEERFILLVALLVLALVFGLRNRFVSAEHSRLVSAERSARDDADRFFQLSPQALAVATTDGFFTRVNERFPEILGYAEAELLGRSFLDLVHPDDLEATLGELSGLGSGRTTLAFENRYRRVDGTYAWLLWNSSPDPVSGSIYATAQDITERKQVEKALRESERRFTELVTTIPEVFFIADANLGGTIYVSPAYETIWGRSCQSLIDDPRSWLEAIHPEDRERVIASLADANETGRLEHEFRIVRSDGEVRLVKELVTVVRDATGQPARHVGIGADITEQRELEEQLQHARKLDAVGRLAGGVAHDFNNILTGISGYTELALARGSSLDEELRSDLEEILAGSRRAGELTRQLLTFARRDGAKPQVVDVNAVIQGIGNFMRGTLREDIVMQIDLAAALPLVRIDPGQLEQVVMNLVLNAGDAMPDGGVITIATEESASGEATIAVRDTGVGMSEATRSRIFEPFFTTKEVGKGTGLGLATVYGIVDACGGRVGVESVLGEGAVFTLHLPSTGEQPAVAPTEVGSDSRRGSERILLVEDDELVRKLTYEMLSRAGYSVVSADSPEDALEHDEDWDLLLTDVVMPRMNGPQLAARLASERPPFRVLFTSGYSGETMIERGALDPAAPLLQKPFTNHELVRSVREVLDRPSSEASA